MSFLSLVQVELKKIRRSKILLLLFASAVILWLPSILNVKLNFNMEDVGISPENNFFIQGFLGMAWFMFPAGMVISTVLICQTERSNKGILKMLALPVSVRDLCMAKFVVLLLLAAVHMALITGMYFVSAAIVSRTQEYDFLLSFSYVCRETGILYLSGIPMAAFYWMIAVCVKTPIFAMGIGLASMIPSVILINTKAWFVYPMAYPFYLITAEYGRLAENFTFREVKLLPWLPAAVSVTVICLIISCLRFGQAQRR